MARINTDGWLEFNDGRRFLAVVLDYETYYLTGKKAQALKMPKGTMYSLRSMATSEYVRDQRFKAHMVSVKVGNQPTQLVPPQEIGRHLKGLAKTHGVKVNQIAMFAHNNMFDGLICSHHYKFVPGYYGCTLSMARALHGSRIRSDLGTVASFYKRGNKMPNVLDEMDGVRDLPPELFLRGGAYCVSDTELCRGVLDDMLVDFPEDELDLIHMTVSAFADPVLRVDTKLALEVHAEEVARRKKLFRQVFSELEPERKFKDDEELVEYATECLGKAEFLAQALTDLGIEPPMKYSLKQKKMIYAFAKGDEEFAALADHPDELVAGLVESRLAVKSTLNITRALRLYDAGREPGWRLPVGYKYYGATTGRWSGTNKMNLQNLPRGGKLRRTVLAPSDSERLNVLDSSQIEARVNAWISGAEWKLAMFRENDIVVGKSCKNGKNGKPLKKAKFVEMLETEDPIVFATDLEDGWEAVKRGPDAYRVAYARSFAKLIDDVTKDERQIGKVMELALGYQGAVGAFKSMAKNYGVRLPDNEVKKLVTAWRRANKEIVKFWADCQKVIEDMFCGRSGRFGRNGLLTYGAKKNRKTGKYDGYIDLPNGMQLKYHNLSMELNQWNKPEYSYLDPIYGQKKIYGGLICENVVQALARIVVSEQLLRIWREVKRRVVMTTHDEGVFVSPMLKAREDHIAARRIFFTPPKWAPDLPVAGDGGWALEYSK